jgi:hypothetical protein
VEHSGIKRFLNVRDRDFVLDVGWLLGAMRLAGSYPLMCRSGLAGTAKTTGLRVLQRLVDPHFIDVRPFKGQDDMFVGALNSWILPFDNISRISGDASDALAMISTGTGYGKRQLYTDADQFMIRVARPILLAGIPSDLAERDDLASRAIVLELPVLSDEEVKYEEEFWADFEGGSAKNSWGFAVWRSRCPSGISKGRSAGAGPNKDGRLR